MEERKADGSFGAGPGTHYPCYRAGSEERGWQVRGQHDSMGVGVLPRDFDGFMDVVFDIGALLLLPWLPIGEAHRFYAAKGSGAIDRRGEQHLDGHCTENTGHFLCRYPRFWVRGRWYLYSLPLVHHF